MYAVWSGNAATVNALLDQGANVNAKDKDGYTPFYWALSYGYLDIAKILIDRGADINSQDNMGATPLMHAIWDGKSDVAKYLIERGANIKAKDGQGYDALLYAVDNGNYEITELLFDKGADVNSKDNRNTTALARAARNADENIILLLAKRGTDFNVKDNEGYTPLSWAVFYKNTKLADIIKNAMIATCKDVPYAKIVFIRESNVLIPGEMQDVPIYIDEAMVANLSRNSTDYTYVKAGKCTMSTKGGILEGNYVKSFDAVSGQTYYFLVTRRIGQAVAGIIGGAIESQIKSEEAGGGGGLFKINPLEESVAKEKIKAILQAKK